MKALLLSIRTILRFRTYTAINVLGLLSIRTILRFRTYTAINVLGLALSLGCVFVLVRYIHQERTVNHFVPEVERTFLTAVFKEGEPRGSLGESEDRNKDPNYRNPLDHPAVEAFSRFMMFDDDFVAKDDYRYAVNTVVVDSSTDIRDRACRGQGAGYVVG